MSPSRRCSRVEPLPQLLWEPACGRGAIVQVLREAGHAVIASDLIDYGFPTHFNGRDFLNGVQGAEPAAKRSSRIPRSSWPSNSSTHALDLCPRVDMLLRLAFLECERRRGILEGRGLARVHVFRNRLPRMHRDDWDGPRPRQPSPMHGSAGTALTPAPPHFIESRGRAEAMNIITVFPTDDGWLVLVPHGHGWNSRRAFDAIRDAWWLSNNLGLSIRLTPGGTSCRKT